MNLKTTSKIVYLSTKPPTQCGIATYTTDLMNAVKANFDNVECTICNIITEKSKNMPPSEFELRQHVKDDYIKVAEKINKDPSVKLVHVQHEFGLFGGPHGNYLLYFLETLKKPVALTFHSVIPNPKKDLKQFLKLLVSYADVVFVMTRKSQALLCTTYGIDKTIITYVPHGTHVVKYEEALEVKQRLDFGNRMILSTFGLLGPGKSIETALNALPKIIKACPDVLYLIIGKTHPNLTEKGEDIYRKYLKKIVKDKKLSNNVRFINRYLDTAELLEYLKATDIYLFTSSDPNQAVSGTFAYAMSCACPIVATSIPHTREVLSSDTGILVDIGDSEQLATSVRQLIEDDSKRHHMAINAFQKTRVSSWYNVAITHINAYTNRYKTLHTINYAYPEINLNQIKQLTTNYGMVQFSKINKPDIKSGYTLDDNARVLIAMCMHYNLFENSETLSYINTYLYFIKRCQEASGSFINYVDENNHEHIKNSYVNLEDSNARAVWALGTFISYKKELPITMVKSATNSLLKCLPWINGVLSPRAIGFCIKGLYLYYLATRDKSIVPSIEKLGKRLITNYDIHAEKDWEWFENYMTYANSVLPEAMLYCYLTTRNKDYKNVAIESFDFLLNKIFVNGHFKVISNNGWHQKGIKPHDYGEQPIDVAYTIQALDVFYRVFKDDGYKTKMDLAFSWFLGKNHLNQFVYNSVTGGCHDGLEETHINLNQGAESTVCYLIARLIMEYHKRETTKLTKSESGNKAALSLLYRKKPTGIIVRSGSQSA